MLDVGFSELLVFGIIALLVLGPEKLPQAARATAKGYGKFKRFVGTIQNEIDQQLNLSELRQEMQAEISRISELERRMTQQFADLQSNLATPLISPDSSSQPHYVLLSSHHLNLPFTLEYQHRLMDSVVAPVEASISAASGDTAEIVPHTETTLFEQAMLAVETAVSSETDTSKTIMTPEAISLHDATSRSEEPSAPDTTKTLEEKTAAPEIIPAAESTASSLRLVV